MIAFWAFCVYIIIYAAKNGDPNKLITILDYNNNACGMKGTVTENYPIGYIYQPVSSLTNAVCVKSCPAWSTTQTAPTSLDCYVDPTSSVNVNNCQASGAFSMSNLSSNYSTYSAFTFVIYNSTLLLNKICLQNEVLDALSSSLS